MSAQTVKKMALIILFLFVPIQKRHQCILCITVTSKCIPYVIFGKQCHENNVKLLIQLGPLYLMSVPTYYLGRVALGEQRPIVIKLSRVRSVGRSVCLSVGRSVCLSSALWKNGRSQPTAVRHHTSDGSTDEAGIGVWQSVHRKGYFWGRIWTASL